AVLVRGAHLARDAHDFRVVRRLLEAVPGEQLDAVGTLLLGEALYELGVFDASERVLARGQALPSGEHVALRLAVTRVKNANWGLCQPEARWPSTRQPRPWSPRTRWWRSARPTRRRSGCSQGNPTGLWPCSSRSPAATSGRGSSGPS
ncbi:MAG TPA: hypothetical protein VN840_15690, partial [Streptosporangiaceae bacterium]|nr:hypothetical protein [Streptosporangiaceae bacterium]